MMKRYWIIYVAAILPFFNIAFAAQDGQELLEKVALNQRQVITDEDFFGVYDEAAKQWQVKPMLDYSVVALRPVEFTAKKGDYEKSADELVKYYRGRKFERQKISAGWNRQRVEFLKDNIIGFDQQEKVAAVFEISSAAKQYELDVSGFLRRGEVVFMLMGRYKNESVSFVNSREADSGKPVLELMIDGSWVAVTAAKDTYVRAGAYKNENYGREKLLRICNSGLKTNKPFDDNTSRALIGFDLSKVPVEKAQKARLKLYAYSEKEKDSLILWRSEPTIINEDTDNWGNMLGYQYSWQGLEGGIEWGRPAGAHSQYPNWVRRFYWLGDMACCAVSGKDVDASRQLVEMLRDFVRDYPDNPRHELNTAGRLGALCKYLPHIFDIKEMSGRDCTEMMKFLWREGEYMRLNPSKLERTNYDNMGHSLITSITTLSITFPELADSALWKKDAFARAEDLMEHLVLPDGSYTEHTMGYPFPVLIDMLDLLEYCRLYNTGLAASYSDKAHQLARYLMDVSMPDGKPIRWGEGNPRNTKTEAVIKKAAVYFNDEQLKWWCDVTKQSFKPQYNSVHYPYAKVAVLRSGWDENAAAMFISPRVGGAHYHADQNHISIAAYGKNLLVDTGMSSYSGGHLHFDWQRHQTKSHNTVEVDEKGFPRLESSGSTQSNEGDCGSELYVSEKVEYFKGYACGYPTVRHDRAVMYLKEPLLYIVADLLQPNDDIEHIYDQCWHLSPLLEFETDGAKISTKNSEVGINIVQLYPDAANCIVRDGFNAEPLGDTKYPSFRQKKAGQTRFYTLLEPTQNGGGVKISRLKTSGSACVFEIDLPRGKGIYLHNYGDEEVSAANLIIKAEFAYISFDDNGEIDYAVMLNGKKLSYGGKEIKFIELSGCKK